MSGITVSEILDQRAQTLRVILTNALGYVVHDMTLPLVVDVRDQNGAVIGFRPYDVDRDIQEAIALHEKRHSEFIKALKARAHLD